MSKTTRKIKTINEQSQEKMNNNNKKKKSTFFFSERFTNFHNLFLKISKNLLHNLLSCQFAGAFITNLLLSTNHLPKNIWNFVFLFFATRFLNDKNVFHQGCTRYMSAWGSSLWTFIRLLVLSTTKAVFFWPFGWHPHSIIKETRKTK